MNEGHSAFLALERIRLLMQEHGLSFEEALEAARANNVFTTHTSVAAGIDLFDSGLMYEYFAEYCREIGIEFEQLMALGRWNPREAGERFSMAILAIQHLQLPQRGEPPAPARLAEHVVGACGRNCRSGKSRSPPITNGVHLRSWLNTDLAELYDEYLQPDWRERYDDPKTWELVDEIPDHELLEVHKRRKRRLISFVRERQVACAVARKASATEVQRVSEVLDPDALTIGFARRFATYKRATLLFRDIGTAEAHPVQPAAAGADRDRRQGASQGPARQDADPGDRAALARSRALQATGLRRGLRDAGGARAGAGRGPVAEQPQARRGSLRHQRHEGRPSTACSTSASWTAGSTRPTSSRAVGPSETGSRTRRTRTKSMPGPSTRCSRTRSCRCTTSAATDGVPRRVDAAGEAVHQAPQPPVQLPADGGRVRQPALRSRHAASARIRQDGFEKIRERLRWNAEVQDVWPQVRILEAGHGAGRHADQRAADRGARRRGAGGADAGRRAGGGGGGARRRQRPPGAVRGAGACRPSSSTAPCTCSPGRSCRSRRGGSATRCESR